MSRVVIALGGNALLRRGQALTASNQQHNVMVASEHLAAVAAEHELVVSHGNGPQVGLLALQGAAYEKVPTYPLDVLGAETQGMIGYLVARELGNRLDGRSVAALLTMIEVDPADPAFANPTKPIGPFYDSDEADALVEERGWEMAADGDAYRRVVPSPRPSQIVELDQIRALLDGGSVVICAGGGGVPTMVGADGVRQGVEAVVDKDFASELLARGLGADRFVMATDIDAVYVDWRQPSQRAIARAHPDAMGDITDTLPAGSMRPKVLAAIDFARSTGGQSIIGALGDITDLLSGGAGTVVTNDADGIEYRS